jgi:trk system potassium uptake protein TrkA
MTILDFANKIRSDTLVTTIERDGAVIIPNGHTKLLSGDNMYVILQPKQIVGLCQKLGIKTKAIRSVLIAGGGTTAYYLAKRLERDAMEVKIIELDKTRAEELSELLPDTMIINGDASDRQLLMEEGISNRDGFVTLTGLDEENMVLSMFAGKMGHAKTITKLNHVSFEEVVSDLPIGAIVSPKAAIAKMILQYVRAMENSYGSNVETLTRLLDGKVEALEFVIRQESDVTGKPLMELKLKKGILVCAIVREGRVITPGGHDDIRLGDNVVIVTTNEGLNDIKDILL